ncbi:MAG: hypothetical protein NTZ35_17710 [Ignavibacteriales bacterium]|nr:hypothetical protein [Ignavibacteriales bacterium]
MKRVVFLPPENFRLMTNENRFSGRLDELGAAVYLTDCVNVNAIADTNLNISTDDVKKNQIAEHENRDPP